MRGGAENEDLAYRAKNHFWAPIPNHFHLILKTGHYSGISIDQKVVDRTCHIAREFELTL